MTLVKITVAVIMLFFGLSLLMFGIIGGFCLYGASYEEALLPNLIVLAAACTLFLLSWLVARTIRW